MKRLTIVVALATLVVAQCRGDERQNSLARLAEFQRQQNTTTKEESYTVLVPVQQERVETYTVCVPVRESYFVQRGRKMFECWRIVNRMEIRTRTVVTTVTQAETRTRTVQTIKPMALLSDPTKTANVVGSVTLDLPKAAGPTSERMSDVFRNIVSPQFIPHRDDDPNTLQVEEVVIAESEWFQETVNAPQYRLYVRAIPNEANVNEVVVMVAGFKAPASADVTTLSNDQYDNVDDVLTTFLNLQLGKIQTLLGSK